MISDAEDNINKLLTNYYIKLTKGKHWKILLTKSNVEPDVKLLLHEFGGPYSATIVPVPTHFDPGL